MATKQDNGAPPRAKPGPSPAGKPAPRPQVPAPAAPRPKVPPPKPAPGGTGGKAPPPPRPKAQQPVAPAPAPDPAPPPAEATAEDQPASLDPPPAQPNAKLDATLRPGDVVAGKYRVDRIVGFGGMGFVVEAWHLGFEERVAVKLLRREVIANAEALVRFEREARSAFKIKSEHVARVIDVGRLDNGTPYMVMEFLEGIDLGALLAERHMLPVEEAVDYVLQAAEAIAEAHTLGIIHRDLKPENLFLCERRDGSRCIKVLDFGLSKVLPKQPSDERERSLTATKQVMGTAEYMSPEQWMSARDVGPGTDMWSLGVILYELLTGHTPFERDQMAQMCQAILGGEPPRLQTLRPEAPAEIEPVILGCLEKDPAERSDVTRFAAEVARFGPKSAVTSAERIASVSRRQGGRGNDGPPSFETTAPVSVDSPISAAPVSAPPPSSVPVVVESQPPVSSAAPSLQRVVPPRSWAKILQERSRGKPQSRGATLAVAGIVALVALILAGVVWTNRHALDPPAPTPSSTAPSP